MDNLWIAAQICCRFVHGIHCQFWLPGLLLIKTFPWKAHRAAARFSRISRSHADDARPQSVPWKPATMKWWQTGKGTELHELSVDVHIDFQGFWGCWGMCTRKTGVIAFQCIWGKCWLVRKTGLLVCRTRNTAMSLTTAARFLNIPIVDSWILWWAESGAAFFSGRCANFVPSFPF